MSSVPAGKRSWKCPECGSDVLLSVAQLDPMACDACVAKMRGGGSTTVPSISDVAGSPLGIWGALPETQKLLIVVVALLVGLGGGFVAGRATAPKASHTPPAASHSSESSTHHSTSSHEESASDDDSEKRPESPGPNYKWVPGRKHKDGTYGQGRWVEKK